MTAWDSARDSGVAQAIAAATATGASVLAVWVAAAYHPGEAMILLGYGLPLAMLWALAGLLFYLPRRVRESARIVRARGWSDPRSTAFLDWAESEQLADRDRGHDA